MRGKSRESLGSPSHLVKRCGLVAIGAASLVLAACGGGGGGGSSKGGSANNPSPGTGSGTAPPPTTTPTPTNAAPTAEAGSDQTVQWPTTTAKLSGSATDADSTTLTYTWSGPAGVTFAASTSAATDVTFPQPGVYQLTLTANDGNSSGSDVVNVTVSPATYPASDTANSDVTNHGWTRVAATTEVGMTEAPLIQAETYALTGGGSGMIVRHGRIVRSWGNIDERFDMKSTTKSIGGIALGLALDNNSIELTDSARTRLPTLGEPPGGDLTQLNAITIAQLATHTAGFPKDGGYWPLSYQPGSTWSYSDGGLNWLADLLTNVFADDLASVLNTRVWTTLGLNATAGGAVNSDGPPTSDIHWRNNRQRPDPAAVPQKRELAAGIFANANAMARVGLLFLNKGVWNSDRILSEEFINTVRTPMPAIASAANPEVADFPNATTNYGVLWWTNATHTLPNVPTDAYWAWGLGDSLIVVIPSLDMVIVRAGTQVAVDTDPASRTWNDFDWNGNYAVLAPFLDPIMQSVTQ